jgi:hypothetical protein
MSDLTHICRLKVLHPQELQTAPSLDLSSQSQVFAVGIWPVSRIPSCHYLRVGAASGWRCRTLISRSGEWDLCWRTSCTVMALVCASESKQHWSTPRTPKSASTSASQSPRLVPSSCTGEGSQRVAWLPLQSFLKRPTAAHWSTASTCQILKEPAPNCNRCIPRSANSGSQFYARSDSCNQEWLLKNSLTRKWPKKLCARKAYKRPSQFS